jgi:hypothetical protein
MRNNFCFPFLQSLAMLLEKQPSARLRASAEHALNLRARPREIFLMLEYWRAFCAIALQKA